MRKTVKLLVVHDRDLIRAGLVALLNERREFQVVAEVASLDKKALRLVRTSKPDVVIMDLDSLTKRVGMPGACFTRTVKY